jgi:hypothetical protein
MQLGSPIHFMEGRIMAQFNLQGRWTSPPQNFEMNLIMTGASEFNIKAISAELQQYWQAGYGEVFESGKVRATFSGPNPDVEVQGFVTTDGQTINWNNGGVWHRR